MGKQIIIKGWSRRSCDRCSTGRTGGVCTCRPRRRGPADKAVPA